MYIKIFNETDLITFMENDDLVGYIHNKDIFNHILLTDPDTIKNSSPNDPPFYEVKYYNYEGYRVELDIRQECYITNKKFIKLSDSEGVLDVNRPVEITYDNSTNEWLIKTYNHKLPHKPDMIMRDVGKIELSFIYSKCLETVNIGTIYIDSDTRMIQNIIFYKKGKFITNLLRLENSYEDIYELFNHKIEDEELFSLNENWIQEGLKSMELILI